MASSRSDGRRFSEEEAAEIFERAARSQVGAGAQPSPTAGMTLAQLQEIGAEVGIPEDLVARAAATLDRPAPTAAKRFLGIPIGVGQSVELGRRLTDDEWERLVVRLRETFDARGAVSQQGSLRQWTNGNLQALVEPTETGHRLRLRTAKTQAPGTIVLAALVAGAGAVGLVGAVFGTATGTFADAILAPLLALLGGAGTIAWQRTRLIQWARERARQMAEIAAQLQSQGPSEGPR